MAPGILMAAPIQGICSMATRSLLDELAATYARRTGVPVSFLPVGGVEAARRVSAGELFDVVALASDAIDTLVAAGKLDAAGKVDLVRSGVGVAVRAGVERPDISTQDALRSAVLGAPGIACSTGPSGVALIALFERWGMADEIRGRLVQAPARRPGRLTGRARRGRAGIPANERIDRCRRHPVDRPPAAGDSDRHDLFGGAGHRRHAAGRRARPLGFMRSADSAEAKRRHGMEPA